MKRRETLTFSASGAAVPAFSSMLTAPAVVVMSAPSLPAAGTNLMVSRGSNFTLSWTPAAVGDLDAIFAGGQTTIECVFPLSSGSDVIPSAVLSQIPAGTGNFSLIAQTSKSMTAGSWSISLLARNSVVNASCYAYVGNVTYQ